MQCDVEILRENGLFRLWLAVNELLQRDMELMGQHPEPPEPSSRQNLYLFQKGVQKQEPGFVPINRGEWAAGLWTFYVVNSHVYYNLDFTIDTLHWPGALRLLLPLFSLFSHTVCSRWKPFRCWCSVKRVLKRFCNDFHETVLHLGEQKNLVETKPQVGSIPAQSRDLLQAEWDVSLVPDEWLLVSANKRKVEDVSLNECTEKLSQYFWINRRNFSKLDLLFLQCWIKMSKQHNSIIGEEIKQHAEYQQDISNCQCHNYLWEMRTNTAKIQLWENWLRATCLQSFKTQFFTPTELYRLAAPFRYWFC